MSVEAMTWVLKNSRATGGDRLALLSLASYDHPDNDGIVWPSVATIAAEAQLGERATRYALRRLEAAGRIRPLEGRSPLRTRRYEIRRDAPADAPSSGPQPVAEAHEKTDVAADQTTTATTAAWEEIDLRLRRVPEWGRKLDAGAHTACRRFTADHPDVPWPQIAEEIVELRTTGVMHTNNPRTGLRLGLKNHREGPRRGRERPPQRHGGRGPVDTVEHYRRVLDELQGDEEAAT